jgi:CHAT domain-containing protein
VRKELEGIVKGGVLPGEIYLDDAFDAVRLRTALDQGFPVVHVASHFVFQPGTDVNSYLMLGDGSRLTLRDIKESNLSFNDVDLFTLSACDTANFGGRDANGREVEGLGTLLQKQGARSVMATLWPVNDESTGVFMQQLYRLRQTGKLSKAEALRQTQLAFVKSSINSGGKQQDFSHPFYWAPFILMGNWL